MSSLKLRVAGLSYPARGLKSIFKLGVRGMLLSSLPQARAPSSFKFEVRGTLLSRLP